jgi:inosine-uridine nucleoside N-ribohydrolase
MPVLHQVILDTDIGTDVDDLMALALILGRTDLDLIGITTVYGDTVLRARLTARILQSVGRQVPIHAGESATLSGRDVWWAGHEGVLHDDLADESYASDNAVAFLVATVLNAPGTIDIIAIGPLTNIARAIAADDRFATAVRHLWIMGGSFGGDEPEHNFRSDAAAAAAVLTAGIPTTISGLEITRRIHIATPELDRIAAAGQLGRTVQAEIRQWWKFWGTEWNVPHDPVTVLTLTDPQLFEFSEPGLVTIVRGDREGESTFTAGGAGRTRITLGLDAASVSAAIVDGIVAGSAASPAPAA